MHQRRNVPMLCKIRVWAWYLIIMIKILMPTIGTMNLSDGVDKVSKAELAQ
jgi:hypothetical protein